MRLSLRDLTGSQLSHLINERNEEIDGKGVVEKSLWRICILRKFQGSIMNSGGGGGGGGGGGRFPCPL